MEERKLVVLTPVKNEAWILPLFCKSASLWADYIIIADQNSTDRSKEIAGNYPKVVVIENKSKDLDEDYRDRILVEKARELVGTNGILFRIDADEIFTPNFDSSDWEEIRNSKAGTVWRFRLLLLNKDLSSYWETPGSTTYGAFVDDGRKYTSHGLIHSRDMFKAISESETCIAENINLLHFQFVDWNRMCSKHRWYQCFERINYPQKSAIDIYRTYHWMYNSALPYKEIPFEWVEGYREKKIEMSGYVKEGYYWWDDKVKSYFTEYTPKYFKHIETYRTLRELFFAEGKNIIDKLFLLYLHCTRNRYNTKKGYLYKLIVKIDSILKYRFRF